MELKRRYSLPDPVDVYFDRKSYDSLGGRLLFCQHASVLAQAIDSNHVIWWWCDKDKTWYAMGTDPEPGRIVYEQWRAFLEEAPAFAEVIDRLSKPALPAARKSALDTMAKLTRLLREDWAAVPGADTSNLAMGVCNAQNIYAELARGCWALPELAVSSFNQNIYEELKSIGPG